MSAVKKRSRRVPAVAVRRKVVTDFPAPLFQETERAAHELAMTRSSLIRTAVASFLETRRREKLERAIAESFSANVELDRQLMDEFRHVDADLTF